MYNLFTADIFKIKKSPVMKLTFTVSFICALTMTAMAWLVASGQLDTGTSGIGFLFSDVNIIGLIGSAIISVTLCNDYTDKTIAHSISCGYGRIKLIAGKSLILLLAAALLLVPYALCTIAAVFSGAEFSMGGLGLGFLYIIQQHSGITLALSELPRLLLAMAGITLCYLAQISLCIPLSLALKKPAPVIILYYALTVVNASLINLAEQHNWINSFLSRTPYLADYYMLTPDTALADTALSFAVSIFYLLLMTGISALIFRKSDLK